MDKDFIEQQKTKLLKKKQHLENQIQRLSTKDHEVKFPNYGDTEGASNIEVEDFEENTTLEGDFEEQLKKVENALEKIKKGKYGISEKTKKVIPKERLEAYPEAKNELG
ncbi:MAG: hypothetical protein ABH837_01185 [bacterium]